MENTEKPVQIIINHKNLEYFISKKLLNRRQTRSSEFFSKFSFKITYKPGSLNNKTDIFTRQSGDVFKKNRRQFEWQTVLKKDSLEIQQSTFGPITNDDSNNLKTFSNPDLIDDEAFSEFPCYHKRCNLGCIFRKRKNTKKLNALNTNQRILKGFFYQKQN